MSKSMSPATGAAAVWPFTQPAQAAGSHATSGTWAHLAARIEAFFASVAARRRRRRARRELAGLDDRILKDIGVTRCEIGRIVHYGRS